MNEYHLRFEDGGLSSPVNYIELSKPNKSIRIKYKHENIRKEHWND